MKPLLKPDPAQGLFDFHGPSFLPDGHTLLRRRPPPDRVAAPRGGVRRAAAGPGHGRVGGDGRVRGLLAERVHPLRPLRGKGLPLRDALRAVEAGRGRRADPARRGRRLSERFGRRHARLRGGRDAPLRPGDRRPRGPGPACRQRGPRQHPLPPRLARRQARHARVRAGRARRRLGPRPGARDPHPPDDGAGGLGGGRVVLVRRARRPHVGPALGQQRGHPARRRRRRGRAAAVPRQLASRGRGGEPGLVAGRTVRHLPLGRGPPLRRPLGQAGAGALRALPVHGGGGPLLPGRAVRRLHVERVGPVRGLRAALPSRAKGSGRSRRAAAHCRAGAAAGTSCSTSRATR